MQRLLSKLTYSNVVSSLCLVLVLGGGTAFAATKLARNSVGTKQLQGNAVTGAKIKAGAVNGEKVEDGSLTGADIKASTLGTVPTADVARTATTATSAQTAQSAKTADSATTAESAQSAKTAQSATTAQTATVATTASSAQTAGSATSAQTATTATNAKNAELAAKATVAEALAGQTAFSVFTTENKEGTKVGPFTVRFECKASGEEVGKILISSDEIESTLGTTGAAPKSFGEGVDAEVSAVKAAAGTKILKVGGSVTATAPSGAALTISNPTIGFEVDPVHIEQCFFSGVIQQLTPLQ